MTLSSSAVSISVFFQIVPSKALSVEIWSSALVALLDGRVMVIPFAESTLATAGSGDVLSGAIVGLLAQGLDPYDAAIAGAYLHALGGELAARSLGEAGVVAGDVLENLPRALNLLTSV